MSKKRKAKKHRSKAPKHQQQFPNITAVLRLWWTEKHPVVLFLLTFVGVVALLYALKVNFIHLFHTPILEANAYLSHLVLNALQYQTKLNATMISSSVYPFMMSIASGCDAADGIMIFVAVLVAFPTASTYQKVVGCLIGTGFLFLANLLRVIGLFVVGVHLPDWFEFAHIELFPFFFVLIALLCCGLWIQWTNVKVNEL